MKRRLTRDLLLIVSIPLVFEIAMFSSCALMLNLAEAERANESQTINVLNEMAPLLVSTIRTVTLAARSFNSSEPIKHSEYTYERKFFDEQLQIFEKTSASLKEEEQRHQALIISKNAQKLMSIIDENARREVDAPLNMTDVVAIRSTFNKIDKASRNILNYLTLERQELGEKDTYMRSVFHSLLWGGLVSSLLVAILCLFIFNKLVRKPLKDLTAQSKAYALGRRLKPFTPVKNEIGDLLISFEKMADELDKQNRLERAIFNNSSDIICTLDDKFKIQFLNNASEKILGQEKQTLVGQSIEAFVPVANAEAVKSQLLEIRTRRSEGSFESAVMRKDGDEIETIWSVRWASDENLYYCCLCDIDYEKKTELMARGLRSILVNELSTSLNAAKISVSEIDTTKISKPKKIQQLDGNFTRIVSLLDDLGQAISNESTDLEPARTECQVSELVRSSIDSLKGLINQKNLQVVVAVQNVVVKLDVSQIQRVLVNLISNAIKVSPVDGTITVNAEVDDSQQLSIEVIDQGCGIPLNKQHLLFERFSQVSKLESTEGKGSGLGLYSARSIVESHGGKIAVISDGVKGCTFKFSLPAGLETA